VFRLRALREHRPLFFPPFISGLAESGAPSPEERGPVETQPGRKAETDRVSEGISEGFHLAESERVAPGGADASALCQARPSRPTLFLPHFSAGGLGVFSCAR
jgi:hypothetical protein